MLSSSTTLSIAFVHSMLQGTRAQGLADDCFLADAGIAAELLNQTGSRITVNQYVNLFESLVGRLDDDLLGLQSRPLRRGSFALIARSAVNAPTLEVAIRRIARTYNLLQDDVVAETVREGALVGLTLKFLNSERPDFLHELLLRVFWRLLAWLVGGKLPVVRFDFAFEQPEYAQSYSKVFPAPLAYNCARSGFWFEASRLGQRVRQDETSLFNFLSHAQANVIIPKRSIDSVSADARSYLQQCLPDWSDMAATANALHMSRATLQRKLSMEGNSFKALRDALRRDIAIVRLSTSMVSLASLSDELGFSDVASFQRAFKGWTGSPPGAYRRMSPVPELAGHEPILER